MKMLGEYIKGNTKLQDVDVSYNKIDDDGIEIISNYIVENETLRRIGFSGNLEITEKSFPCLLRIAELSKVEEIYVLQTSITQQGALNISIAIKMLKQKSSEIKLRQK